jgi:hypothetical protein
VTAAPPIIVISFGRFLVLVSTSDVNDGLLADRNSGNDAGPAAPAGLCDVKIEIWQRLAPFLRLDGAHLPLSHVVPFYQSARLSIVWFTTFFISLS